MLVSVTPLPTGHTTTCVDGCNYTWTGGPATSPLDPRNWGFGRPIFALDMRDPAHPWRLELQAGIEGLIERLSCDPVNILTDSQLVVGIFSQNWKARANLELVMKIRDLLKEFPQLTFAYVRGHNGNQGNELADSLAREAAESQKGINRH